MIFFFFSNEDIPRCHQRGPNLAKETQLSLNYSKVYIYTHNNCESVQGKPRHTIFCIMTTIRSEQLLGNTV